MALRAQRSPRWGFSWTMAAIALALIAAILIVYAPVRHHDFVDYDDALYVTENPHVVGGLTAANVSWALTSGYATNWHPLTWMSHMLDVQLFGLNAGPEHVTNVVIHIANTLLLFWLLRSMTGATWPSAFVAALFAVHPLHVESVAWIAERKDVLSTLFWLLTTWAYAAYAHRPRWTRYCAVVLLLVLGLMAKPMLVTLPFVLLLLDVWPLARLRLGWRRLILEKLPLAAVAIGSMVITFVVQAQGGAVAPLTAVPLTGRIANALVSYVVYLEKMIWPARLAVFYPYPPVIPDWQPIVALLLLAGISVAFLRLARRYPYLIVGWLWYFGTLVPVIGLVQVGRQALADRYTYVPFIGLFIVVAWGVPALFARWPWRRFALPAAAIVIVLTYTIVARAQVAHWQDASTLWYHALEVTADNDRAHEGVGVILANLGRTDDAVAHFSEAIRIDPTFAAAHLNLGKALAEQGHADAATDHYREAIRFMPQMAEAHHNLGLSLATRGQFDEAISEYREALRLKPDYSEAHHNLGGALVSEGKVDEAIAEYREALRLKPSLAAVHASLGLALSAEGKIPEAIEEYSQALRLKPGQADLYYSRGFAFANLGKVDEAIADFSESVRLKPDFGAAHVGLAMALGAAGRLNEAKREFARAKETGAR